jgi:FAD/FMN-containing dehydrogenase
MHGDGPASSQTTASLPEHTSVLERRGFLAIAGAAAGTSALLPHRGVAGLLTRAAGPTGADWAALRGKLSTHRLLRPGQNGYNTAKELFDPRFDGLRPAGVAFCAVPRDVATCVNFARKFKLPVRARSGGHSYAGWSSVTGGLVVDVSRLSSFSTRGGAVTVGSGLGLLEFYRHLAGHGLAVPGGSCPTVGIAGLALGGGVGVLSRQYGLTSDHLQSVQLVTADGSVLTCNAKQHSDLLWACRGGGGGNFGIATSFTFSTHRLTDLVLFFLSWPWQQARHVVAGWQDWVAMGHGALWTNMHLSAPAGGGSPSIGVGGTYIGSVSRAGQLLRELYRLVGSAPAAPFLARRSFLDAMLIEAGCGDLTVPSCLSGPGAQRVPSFAKSDFFSKKLNSAGITTLINGISQLRNVHGTAGGAGGIAFDALGGAVNQVEPHATAFVHRTALFNAQYLTEWTSPGTAAGVANQHAWLRSFYARLHPHGNGEAYQNYIDPELTNWQQAYYGENYPRLQRIKARYDPADLFTFPQAIKAP